MADTCAVNDSCTRKSRILFGSCTSIAYEQPLWPVIESRNATAFVWVGDAIYSDRNIGLNFSHFPPKVITQDATPERLRQLYSQQLSHAGYRNLLDNTNITIFGTVDDHDYGSNNGDMTYRYKRESVVAFVEFTGESFDSPIAKRARQGLGVYGVKVFDFARPPGQELVPDTEAGLDPDVAEDETTIATPTYSEKSAAVFVLDARTNKTPWTAGWKKFYPNNDGDFLGEQQWRWFETAIGRSRASVNIVAQGLQVHSNKYPDGNVAEEWTRFPRAQQRLYNAVLQDNVKAPIFISGDVHMGELLRKDCRPSLDSSSAGRTLMEMTTSGMTHSWGSKNVCSRPGSSAACGIPYTKLAAKTFMHFAHWVSPWTELVRSFPQGTESGGAEGAKTGKQYSLDLNFGELEFDWADKKVKARILGTTVGGQPLLSAEWTFADLTGNTVMSGSQTTEADYLHARDTLIGNRIDPGHWICVNYQGHANMPLYALGVMSSMSVFMILLFLPLVVLTLLCTLVFRRCLKGSRKAKAL